ncbi:class I tRNA ligase family protein [Candidatus Sodalis endolongispinus]|uniref:Class I tRNA ligase family protein n=1 Tax=Candidatus Sodalis endolongispinus TaxID=2812662 RepID=A0ABS5YAQ9_9GAMM|nr:class I tRNA ligase family protein [Candidatus Sodalis endolongispinus]MBT9432072.1 class I tRNA ligase family protein [Candidatus Sodalis endolongispinus]
MNWLTYEGDKFSTSRQRGVFTGEALTLFPADYWRYTLFCMMPETSDTDFYFSAMAQVINKDLADNLGNFINRLVTLIVTNFDGVLPAGYSADPALSEALAQDVAEFDHQMQLLEFRKAGAVMRRVWTRGNEYITHQQHWRRVKIDPLASAQVLKNCLGLLRVYSCVLAPIAPGIAARIRAILPVDGAVWPSARAAL